jgi:hypothetical protein
MYIWDQELNQGEGGYRTHNGTLGIPEGTTPFIHPTQGFFVHASGTGNLSFDADSPGMLTHSTQGFYKDDPVNVLRLKVAREGSADETVIQVNPNSTNGFDPVYDSYKLFSGNPAIPEIFSVTDDLHLLTINAIRDITATVPLRIRSGIATTILLEASGIGSFEPDVDIFLEDKLTGQVIDLRESNTYFLDIEQGDNDNRLSLLFEPATSTDSHITKERSVWAAHGYIFLPGDCGNSTLSIFSLTGQRLYERFLTSRPENGIRLSLTPGCYIIMISNREGRKTSKLIIQ